MIKNSNFNSIITLVTAENTVAFDLCLWFHCWTAAYFKTSQKEMWNIDEKYGEFLGICLTFLIKTISGDYLVLKFEGKCIIKAHGPTTICHDMVCTWRVVCFDNTKDCTHVIVCRLSYWVIRLMLSIVLQCITNVFSLRPHWD